MVVSTLSRPRVGHADDDILDAEVGAGLDDRLHGRDHAFGALQREPLVAEIFELQEAFERFRRVELAEDVVLVVEIESRLVSGVLEALLQPGLLLGILDMHELDPDGRAIGLLKHVEQFAQRRELEPEYAVDEDRAVVVGFRETVARGVELRMVLFAFELERVEVGDQVAAHPVGADHHQRADAVERLLADLLGAQRLVRRPSARRGQGVAVCAVGLVEFFITLARRRQAEFKLLEHGLGVVSERGEERAPLGGHRVGLLDEAGVEPFDEGAVGAEQKGGFVESCGHAVHCLGGCGSARTGTARSACLP